jgi:hypothetical protein
MKKALPVKVSIKQQSEIGLDEVIKQMQRKKVQIKVLKKIIDKNNQSTHNLK